MKRLFIEIDELEARELATTEFHAANMHGLKDEDFFDTVIDDAMFKTKELVQAIKDHDEIYCSTSLIPRYGFGSSIGSGNLFNQMMYKAIEDEIFGKKVFIMNEYDNIRWYNLKRDLVDKAFSRNFLYVRDENFENWVQVDIDKLIKTELDETTD